MDQMTLQEKAVREVMEEWLAFLTKRARQDVELIVDSEKKRFILMSDGWMKFRRLYGPMIDVGIKNGKIWIYEDNTEEGIPDELVAKGIPPQQIVLGWQPEYKRDLTGFAVG